MSSRVWVAVVGAPAAGKTTFARALAAHDPMFRHVTDLVALQELVALESGASRDPDYWRDVPPHTTRRTEPAPGGGFHILDPSVWDDALKRVIARHRALPRLIVEFARGNDPAYLSQHGVPEQDCYEPSFEMLSEELDRPPTTALVIVHVAAPFEIRMDRNRVRREAGSHFVAEDVMRSVYARDALADVSLAAIASGRADGAFRVQGTERLEDNVRAFVSWWDDHVRAERFR